MAGSSALCLAQVGQPGAAGLTPRTPTIDVGTNFNNANLETGGAGITANTNVVLAWEDDGADITYWAGPYTVFDRDGLLLTPNSSIDGITGPCGLILGGPITTTYRSFYRDDGSATPSYLAWGGKVKPNLFGNGFVIGGSADQLACEVTNQSIVDIQLDISAGGSGDFPAVQFLNNDGSRDATLGGPNVAGIASFDDAACEADGNIRMGDFERLSNGNIVIVGEDRNGNDLVTMYGGTIARRFARYTVLNAAGGVVKTNVPVSASVEDRVEIWHGVAVTANGFAVRFNVSAGSASTPGVNIRFFDNNGDPTSGNIHLATLVGNANAGGGGRGDGAGFHGNGTDAIVHAASSAQGPWVTVLNANGTVRYSKAVTAPDGGGVYANMDRGDAAIQPDGRVIVAFDATNNDTNNASLFRLPQAVLVDGCGNPGPVVYLSEREEGTNAVASNGGDGRPRVAFRNNTVAAMWGSLNNPNDPTITLAMRIFDVAPAVVPTLSISGPSGGNVTLTWSGGANLYTAPAVGGPYTQVGAATSPYVTAAAGTAAFYKVGCP